MPYTRNPSQSHWLFPQHATSLWPSKTDVGNIVKPINAPSVICGHLYEPLPVTFTFILKFLLKRLHSTNSMWMCCVPPAYFRDERTHVKKRKSALHMEIIFARSSEQASERRTKFDGDDLRLFRHGDFLYRAYSWSDFLI